MYVEILKLYVVGMRVPAFVISLFERRLVENLNVSQLPPKKKEKKKNILKRNQNR